SGLVGQKRHIAFNDNTNEIECVYKHDSYPGFSSPPSGSTFRIVRPAVTISIPNATQRYQLFGGQFPYLYDSFPVRSGLRLRNIEIAVADGITSNLQTFGQIEFIGVHFTHNHSSPS